MLDYPVCYGRLVFFCLDEMLTSIMRQYKLNRFERKFVAATYDSQLKKCLKDPAQKIAIFFDIS